MVIKVSNEKKVIRSIKHLIVFYGEIFLPVGLLRNLQWNYLKESFYLKEVKICDVDYYKVQIKKKR